MSHPGPTPDPDQIILAIHALGETCVELAAEGCKPAEITTALAALLAVVVAAIDCCEEHAAQAEEVAVEIFEEQLASHRQHRAAFKRVGAAGMHTVEGHA